MNRRFFISSSIAVVGFAVLSRLPSWAQPNEKVLSGVLAVSPHPGPLPGGEGVGVGRDSTFNSPGSSIQEKSKSKGIKKVTKTDAEWKSQLTPEQYDVLRHEGTEYAFTSPLNDIHDKGTFICAGCELPVFSSAQKFDSGTGWPSFWAPLKKENVIEETDRSAGMTRTKVSCAQCEGHLGHVFDDGPKPTGLRYCMNGVAMKFVKG
ncbi:MAG TPA: peptide-methionine (R)-S-oxide reductase [Blastocatellia bacterium]|nr:peptide-methionine (R)-S-oxide reductase [Blastocatellia bacterium]